MTDGGDRGGGPEDGTAEVLDRPLPDGVRRRVVGIVSDAFGALTMAELPAPLRQYARFAPNRRAKFAGNAMAAALETERLFRQRIGERYKETQPELCGALEAGAPPPAADPLDVAAAAYVLRPPGWAKLVAAAGEEAQRADAERVDEESRAELEKLREELERAREHTRAETARLRAELDAAKKEADALHRKLRSALSDVKRGEAALRKERAETESARAEGQAAVSAAESESRRLKTRLGESEAALEATRRAVREGRSVEDMRVRLLLDTVLEAAQGLRRELALPPVSVRPAETVDAVEPGRMTPRTSPPAPCPSTTRPSSTSCSRCRRPIWWSTATTSPRPAIRRCRWRSSGSDCSASSPRSPRRPAPRSPVSSTAPNWPHRYCSRRRAGCGCCSPSRA